MPRAEISMTAEEVEAFLCSQNRCVLATLDEDGSPRGEAAVYEVSGGALVVVCAPQTIRTLRRDPRACAIVEEFPAYHRIKGVIVHARAELLSEDRARLPLDDVASFDFAKIPRPGRTG